MNRAGKIQTDCRRLNVPSKSVCSCRLTLLRVMCCCMSICETRQPTANERAARIGAADSRLESASHVEAAVRAWLATLAQHIDRVTCHTRTSKIRLGSELRVRARITGRAPNGEGDLRKQQKQTGAVVAQVQVLQTGRVCAQQSQRNRIKQGETRRWAGSSGMGH